MDVGDPPGDIRFDVDEHGRAVTLSLSSGWRDRIPAALLGVMLTAELARLTVTDPVVVHPDLWRGTMWASRAAQVQNDLAEIQGELVALCVGSPRRRASTSWGSLCDPPMGWSAPRS